MLNRTQQDLLVEKRDGRQVSFNENLIRIAISKAFCAEQQVEDSASLDQAVLDRIDQMTLDVLASLTEEAGDRALDVEKIQDVVERTLMRYEYYSVARRYILYREEHARMRKLRAEERLEIDTPFPSVLVNRDGRMENVDFDRLS
jgi:ribonucleoside-diphosphate reductase alpha chain